MRKVLSLFPLVLLAACGSEADGGDTTTDDRATVVVTTSILGDIVSGSVGDVATVEVVMPTGADPHDFAPSARQAAAMEDADLLVVNGLDLEAGMASVIDAVAADGTPVFVFADHVDTVTGDARDGDHADEQHGDAHDGDHADEQHGDDPHLWMDPTRVASGVEALAVALGAGPAAEAYLADLAALDVAIASAVSMLPEDRRNLVTNHDSLGYFADRYGFHVLGAVIPSLTTTAEASASALEDLARLIRETDVPAIFAETTESDRLAVALADEVGGEVEVVELFTGSLGGPGSGAETYLGMMTTNTERIVTALGGPDE